MSPPQVLLQHKYFMIESLIKDGDITFLKKVSDVKYLLLFQWTVFHSNLLYFCIILAYDSNSDLVLHTQAAEYFFDKNKTSINLKELENKRFYNLDIKVLLDDSEFLSRWCTFKDDLVENAEKTISCISLALHQVYY